MALNGINSVARTICSFCRVLAMGCFVVAVIAYSIGGLELMWPFLRAALYTGGIGYAPLFLPPLLRLLSIDSRQTAVGHGLEITSQDNRKDVERDE